MTRKDYVAIAECIRAVREGVAEQTTGARYSLAAVDTVAYRLASVLQADNERFDRDRFLLASNFGNTQTH